MKKSCKTVAGGVTSVAELARRMRKPRSSVVYALAQRGCPIAQQPPWLEADIVKFEAWFAARTVHRSVSTGEHRERERLLKARADRAEFENARARGEYIPKDEVEEAFGRWSLAVRNVFLWLVRDVEDAGHVPDNSLKSMAWDRLTQLHDTKLDCIPDPPPERTRNESRQSREGPEAGAAQGAEAEGEAVLARRAPRELGQQDTPGAVV